MKKRSTGQASLISKPVSEEHSLSGEILSADENEELTPCGLKDEFFELLNHPEWFHLKIFDVNLDFKDAAAGSLRAWSKQADNPTTVCMKWEHWFPDVEPEELWKMVGDVENRLRWDDKWVDGRILEEREDSTVVYFKTPKPPIPMISAREMVIKFFNIQDGAGEGRHL